MPRTIADQFGSIPVSPDFAQTIGRAQEFARGQSHRALLLEHLLLALAVDPDAAPVLRTCNVDAVQLSTDVSGYLGRLPEDMRAEPGIEPSTDQELLRVLEAARQAAQQSRRRVVDGSIVLAAVVGDGKSPAAGLLKAHGMTFDEAIRALQKATAQARSKQYAAGQAASEPAAKTETKPVAAPPAPEPAVEPAADAQPPPFGQSVDDILAAARARIQQRAAAGKPEPKPKPPTKPSDEADTLSLMSLSSFKAGPAPPTPELPPPLDLPQTEPGNASAPDGTPLPGLPPTPRLPQSTAQAPPPPPPAPANAGPPPPPSRADGAAPSRLSSRVARARPPDQTEPAGSRPPVAANGKTPVARRPPAEGHRPAARPGPAVRGQRAATAPLVEAIPRRMRVGAAAPAQVRIGRDKVDGLMQLLLAGRGQPRPDAVMARVLTVRLRAPDGGFWIEAASPETQWVEASRGPQPDEPISWRWTVTPRRRGRRRLQLVVAARTIGRDGVAVETAPPDRVIEVAVGGNHLRRVLRWIAFLGVLGIGVALGRFGGEVWHAAPALLENVLGLLRSSGFLAG